MCNSCIPPDLFLPNKPILPNQPTTKRNRPDQKKRSTYPFQGLARKRNGKGYTRNTSQKDAPTQHLSSSDVLAEFNLYVSNLSREECCVSVKGEARKCNCFQFLSDQPKIINLVALGLVKY